MSIAVWKTASTTFLETFASHSTLHAGNLSVILKSEAVFCLITPSRPRQMVCTAGEPDPVNLRLWGSGGGREAGNKMVPTVKWPLSIRSEPERDALTSWPGAA